VQPIRTEPFYFGRGERLFGVLDAPASEDGAAPSVLICQPFGHEYVWCHRACRQLALRLAGAGCTVLRFDYDGCGDSLGESHEADLERWVGDAAQALDELRARRARPRVPMHAVGLRLGAAVAALACERLGGVERLVLWEPVLDGRAHLLELARLHAEHEARQGWSAGESLAAAGLAGGREVLGFALSPALLRDLEALDLRAPARPPAPHVCLLRSRGEACGWAASLAQGAHVEELCIEEAGPWIVEPYKLAMPVKSLAAIAERLAGSAA
jgi:pimeloyl-ACP methyl ester carboxylesterase